MFVLTKNFSLIKPEYERLVQEVFQFPILERQYTEINEYVFRMKYIAKYHPEDTEKLAAAFKAASDANDIASKNWGRLLLHVVTMLLRLHPADGIAIGDLTDLYTSNVTMDAQKITFTVNVISANKSFVEHLNELIPDDDQLRLYDEEFFRYHSPSYNDAIESCFPEMFAESGARAGRDDNAVYVHNFTFQTSENCNLNCTYCYQGSKTASKMSYETGKAFIDNLLSGAYGYINDKNSPALIIEFIGGDPFLEMPLTRKLYEYFLERTYQLDHPWFQFHRLSLCSNGLLYFDQDVQDFFRDFAHKISFNISIDGNRELHDACRIQPNGEGSYDVDMTALKHYSTHYASEKNSKMTLAPSNIKYLFESVVDFIGQGMSIINLNCIFEEGWTAETALMEYNELKRLGDYILENDLEHLFIAIFSDDPDELWDKSFDGNFCFTAGTMVQTEAGIKAIEDVRTGDLVTTGRYRTRPVEKVMTHKADNICSVRLNGEFGSACTLNHRFFTRTLISGTENEYNAPAMIAVGDLRSGDQLALAIHSFGNVSVTPEFAHIVGRYLISGSHDERAGKYQLRYDRRDVEYVDNQLQTLGIMHSITCDSFAITDTFVMDDKVAELKAIIDSIPSEREHRSLPAMIYHWDRQSVVNLMRGMGVCPSPSHTYFITGSRMLAEEILLLERSLSAKGYFHKIDIDCIDNNFVVKYSVDEDKQAQYDPALDVVWSPIVEITLERPDTVYNLTVAEDHSYIADGKLVSNCGGTGAMLSMGPDGNFYPCLRYMPSSIGDDVPGVQLGNVHSGMIGREQGSDVLELFDSITRRSQSTDVCYNCPIGSGCAWCSANCHQSTGTANRRTTFHCIQTIAESLANVYYWNLLNIKQPAYNLGVRKNNVPDEWALKIISKEELDYLKAIESRSAIATIDHEVKMRNLG